MKSTAMIRVSHAFNDCILLFRREKELRLKANTQDIKTTGSPVPMAKATGSR
jgi:hypothetical protein